MLHNHIRNKYDVKKYWEPGMPLTEMDMKLLAEVKQVYESQGLVPTKNEISVANVGKLKARFRTWGNVLLAAGLPALNDPEEKRKRIERNQK